MAPRLQVGIDFSHRAADACLLEDQGEFVVSHRSFANAVDGYDQLKALLLKTLQEHGFQGLDISGEAATTGSPSFCVSLRTPPDNLMPYVSTCSTRAGCIGVSAAWARRARATAPTPSTSPSVP